MEARIEIASGDYRLVVAPSRGGSILAFEWRGKPLLREATGAEILDVACFPLVPYSNRISQGRFNWRGQEVALSPNFPVVDPCNPLHGFGWLSEWSVVEASEGRLRLEHVYRGGEWPWPYRSELAYQLSEEGLTAVLSLTNLATVAMPAGLGFHPYFPRNSSTRYLGLHRGEWLSDADALPLRIDLRPSAIDWWHGEPVSSRNVDTVYSGREGALMVAWPDRALALQIDCSPNLPHTSIYAPSGSDWFCIEPVSHLTDALNRAGSGEGMTTLNPGASLVAQIRLRASSCQLEAR
jgi:aldose 1-epimerase